jgi:hypothetical protein
MAEEQNEQWRVIAHHPKYQISNIGNVRKEIKNGYKPINLQTHQGYKYVQLWNNNEKQTYRVHRLVAFAFIGGQLPNKPQIDHIDRNRANNNADNLRWCDARENALNRITNRDDIPSDITNPTERCKLRENAYRSVSLQCGCGAKVSRRWVSIHNKTKKHIRFMEINDENDENDNVNVN